MSSTACHAQNHWDQSTHVQRFGALGLEKTGVFKNNLLGKIGALEVRLAQTQSEIRAAQNVRYSVFYEEMDACLPKGAAQTLADSDSFDAICDHLIVLDQSLSGTQEQRIVATYRLLRQEVAIANGGFYSANEFELSDLIARHRERNFLELGRSCVLPNYRTKRGVELLWQGIWSYCNAYNIDVMTGCASFSGTVPAKHAQALSFLHHHCRADETWATRALGQHFNAMDMMPSEAINLKQAVSQLPPLIKGYWRLGAFFGEGCVIDPDFGTCDVLVILPVERIAPRYLNHFTQ